MVEEAKRLSADGPSQAVADDELVRWVLEGAVAAAGLFAAALGFSVLLGWHTHSVALIQVHRAFSPMQYNTALGFLLAGVGLAALTRRQKRVAEACGALAGGLGLATLTEYFLGTDLGIDRVFIEPYITVGTSHPGRMGPNSALCFALIGSAIVFGARHSTVARRASMLGLVGSVTVSLGVVALFGYMSGITEAYGWGRLTQMAVHTAGGFLVLGTALVLFAWHAGSTPQRRVPPWLPMPVAIGAATASILLWQALVAHDRTRVMGELDSYAERARTSVAIHLQAHVLELTRMASRWAVRGGMPRAEWEADARAHVADHPEYRAIEWVDRSFKVRWIAPLENNEAAIGLDLAAEPARRNALQASLELAEPTISEPVELVQGGAGLLVYVPIAIAGEFGGFILGVLDAPALFATSLREVPGGPALSVFAGGKQVFVRDGADDARGALDDHWSSDSDYEISGVVWRTRASATPAWLAANRSPLPNLSLSIGMLLSLLFGRLVHLAQAARERARLAAVVNESLEREIASHGRAQRALQSSEERWRTLFERAPDPFYIHDTASVFVGYNDAAARLIGYSREEVIGRSYLELGLCHPDDLEKAADEVMRNIAGEATGPTEYRVLAKDGHELIVAIHSYPMMLGDDRLILRIARDMTEHKKHERELEKRLEFERIVTVLATDLINRPTDQIGEGIEKALEQTATFAGADLAAVFTFRDDDATIVVTHEWPAENLTAHEDVAAGFPADASRWFTCKLETGEPVYISDVATFPTIGAASREWMLSRGQRSFVAVPVPLDGRMGGYVGFVSHEPRAWDAESVTLMQIAGEMIANALARAETESTLRESEQRFRQIADNIEQLFFIVDLHPLRVVYASDAMERVWTVTRERLGEDPMTWFEDIVDDDRDMAITRFAAALEGPEEFEYRVTRPDGQIHWLRTRVFPVSDAGGEVFRIAGMSDDITTRKRAESELEHYGEFERLIGRLASGLINVPVEELDEAVERALAEIGRFVAIDRCAIFLLSADRERVSNTHEWCADGIPSKQDGLQDLPIVEFPWLVGSALQREIVKTPRVADLGAEAGVERDVLLSLGVHSRIQVPLVASHGVVGALVLVSHTEEKQWTDDLTMLLKVAAETFANALERSRREGRIEHYQEKLRGMASEVSLAEERERRRIAADLHDRTIQNLGLCRLKLGQVRASLGEEAPASSPELDDTCRLLQETIQETRSLVFEFSSPVLYELGFVPAVEWLAERMHELYGVEYELRDDGAAKPLDDDVAVGLFQAVRELMANVGKHASASRALVTLERAGSMLRIVVEDDGVGFDSSLVGPRLDEASGYGLFSIRERASVLGGRLDINSGQGRGTRVTLEIPLRADERVEA